ITRNAKYPVPRNGDQMVRPEQRFCAWRLHVLLAALVWASVLTPEQSGWGRTPSPLIAWTQALSSLHARRAITTTDLASRCSSSSRFPTDGAPRSRGSFNAPGRELK